MQLRLMNFGGIEGCMEESNLGACGMTTGNVQKDREHGGGRLMFWKYLVRSRMHIKTSTN